MAAITHADRTHLHLHLDGVRVQLGDGDQWRVLTALAQRPDEVRTKDQLLRDTGLGASSDTRRLDSACARLRRVLANAGTAWTVANVWGVGYKLAPTTHE